MRQLTLTALAGIPEVRAGDSLAALIRAALARTRRTLAADDVVVVAQKIVSKAEGRQVRLDTVQPTARALELARAADKDPRLIELVLRESRDVLRVKPGVVIVEHRLGFVMANAGVDQSNLDAPHAAPSALLLPEDPDASARRLRAELCAACGVEIGVIINDSFGRAWRNGVTGIAIGVAGVPALVDMRGLTDRAGRELRVTQIAAADELAAAASLVMGQGSEGFPVVLARGFPYRLRESSVAELIRLRAEDLFR
ncbi:MAG: coenzyme F420-0:L-glutamate ligase [Betaproteobacteria bacterium]|nr:MAG: coenzyme F420-0:L-glutamate ligase [Betaproteobacteria bacterium]